MQPVQIIDAACDDGDPINGVRTLQIEQNSRGRPV
jgi:hypothetical protein